MPRIDGNLERHPQRYRGGLVRHLVALACLAGGNMTFAQQLEPPTSHLLDSRVDVVLREWASRSKTIRSLYTEFSRTTYDPVWKVRTEEVGSARYISPDRARLDIQRQEEREIGGETKLVPLPVESYVMPGNGEIWEYDIEKRQVTVYQLPPQEAQKIAAEGPLPFLFGTTPQTAKARYHLRIVEEDDKLLHLLVHPKLAADQQNFSQADIWLDKANDYLPRRLQFLEPSKTEVTFEFSDVWRNIKIEESDFQPEVPKGFEVMRQKVKTQDLEERRPTAANGLGETTGSFRE